MEVTEVANLHLVASQELFTKASHRVSEDTLDGTFRERQVVIGKVLAEIVERENFVNLCFTISFCFSDVGLFCAGLSALNSDAILNHNNKI